MKTSLCAVALCAATIAAQTSPITPLTAVAVERWAEAVTHHVPGQVDDALMLIEGLTADDRTQISSGMNLFRDALAQKPTRVRSGAERRIVDLGAGLAQHPGLTRFVDLAIVLHGDAAIVAVQHPDVVPVAVRLTSRQQRTAIPSQQALERDGELVGATESNWNWAFARDLVSLRTPGSDASFLATWFHATSAFLMSRRQYGDARNQLDAAAAVVPNDARIRFDRACYFEMQGLPESQVFLSVEDIVAIRARQGTNMRNNLMTKSEAAKRTGVRPANIENADAERLFRSALDIDPGLLEARVRLARLLGARGRQREAAEELTRVLSIREQPDPVVTFFAHLFSGRVNRALGKLDTAAADFREALALFPNAQSALLGLSQVAVLRSDVTGALAPIRQLEVSTTPRDRSLDPWWNYSVGLGRTADALLAEMWSTVRRP